MKTKTKKNLLVLDRNTKIPYFHLYCPYVELMIVDEFKKKELDFLTDVSCIIFANAGIKASFVKWLMADQPHLDTIIICSNQEKCIQALDATVINGVRNEDLCITPGVFLEENAILGYFMDKDNYVLRIHDC